MASPARHTSGLPWTVKAASAVLVAYGLWVVINATLGQMATNWADAKDYPRALIRLGGMLLIAYGLLRRQRWGWWFGVLMPSLLLLLLATGVVALRAANEDPTEVFRTGQFLFPALCLVVALGLLLTPTSRAAFPKGS
jgi:peptidoglycan/LPS O-acetylase OafA/YrhL